MWPFAKVEHRESATDAIVTALIAQAGGSSAAPSVEALGAVEAAAGLWARAFASASVEPATPATMALTPSVLAAIGRGLAVRGEAVYAIEANGVVSLTQASAWTISGGTRPESWLYAVELPLPSGKVSKRTLPAGVYRTRPICNAPRCALGRVSLPSAWPTRPEPWQRGLRGVYLRKPPPQQVMSCRFLGRLTWTR